MLIRHIYKYIKYICVSMHIYLYVYIYKLLVEYERSCLLGAKMDRKFMC